MQSAVVRFSRRVLGMTGGIEEMGSLRLELLGLLLLAWVIVYFCLWRGVKLTGRVVYITATAPIFLLLAFAVRAATLPGAIDGLRYFFLPDWSKVFEAKVWVTAASQVGLFKYQRQKIIFIFCRFLTRSGLHSGL